MEVSNSTLNLWIREGITRKAKTGNHAPEVLRGEHRFWLVLYRLVYPKASADEVRGFISRESSDHAVFTRDQVGRAEKELGFTTKRASTQAFQAFTEENVRIHRWFWTRPWPLGVVGTPRARLCDVDEFGLWLEKCNRSYGKSPRGLSCSEPGKYGHGDKFSVILAVMPDGSRWCRARKVAGTSAEAFDNFINGEILTGARAVPAHPQVTFMWDNLAAHHSPLVLNSVYAAGHRILPRPPYRPVDAPIEYVIHSVEAELSRQIYHMDSDDQLEQKLYKIVRDLTGFDEYFRHCGYS